MIYRLTTDFYLYNAIVGCNGESLQSVMDGAQTFLNYYPTETLILKFSHTRHSPGHDPADIIKKVKAFLTQQQYALYDLSSHDSNLAQNILLGAVRGKIIAVFDESEKDWHTTPPTRFLLSWTLTGN